MRLAALGALAALLPAAADAHPHVFADYGVALEFSDRDLAGVRLTWTFDEQFSSGLLHDYKDLKRKPIAPATTALIQRKEFDFLKTSNYFTEIVLDGKPLTLSVRDFAVTVAGDRVTYSFTVPIPAGGPVDGTVRVVPFDDEFYVQFTRAARAAASIEGTGGAGASCQVAVVQRDAGMWGMQDADQIDCKFHRTES